MLNAEEAKAVLVTLWNRVNANPELRYGRKAFLKLAEAEFNKSAVAKLAKFDEPLALTD